MTIIGLIRTGFGITDWLENADQERGSFGGRGRLSAKFTPQNKVDELL